MSTDQRAKLRGTAAAILATGLLLIFGPVL